MFKQVEILYPTDEKILTQINNDIATFRCAATVRYIESLNLNNRQIEALYAKIAEDVTNRQRTNTDA